MTTIGLIFKEIRHRKTNFVLGVLAVAMAVAMLVAFFTASKAAERETARLMLTLGYNLHIIPKDTDMEHFLVTKIPDKTMPQQYLQALANQKKVSYNHLLASLQKQMSWRGINVILTGLATEICPPGSTKPSMAFQIEPGTVYVGHQIAQQLSIHKDDVIDIGSKTLKVARCLAESGGVDDMRLQCHLNDAQEILNLPEQISEIRAVDCLCFNPTDDPATILRKQIGSILPEAKVFHIREIASTRSKTRQMIRNLFALIMPFILIACGVWIGILSIMNVRDRRQEIGIMRAIGHGSEKIAALFLGKAVIAGILGAMVGFAIGTLLALGLGPGVFKITAATILNPEWSLLSQSLVLAPLFAAVASFIPIMIAVAYDPAITLREE